MYVRVYDARSNIAGSAAAQRTISQGRKKESKKAKARTRIAAEWHNTNNTTRRPGRLCWRRVRGFSDSSVHDCCGSDDTPAPWVSECCEASAMVVASTDWHLAGQRPPPHTHRRGEKGRYSSCKIGGGFRSQRPCRSPWRPPRCRRRRWPARTRPRASRRSWSCPAVR
jgi:hypothetical protein